MKPFNWISGCGMLLFHLLLAARVGAETPPAVLSSAPAPVAVPDLAHLRSEAVARGFSVVKRNLRIGLFGHIEAMTTNHLRLYRQALLPSAINPDAAGWAVSRVGAKRIPRPDRATIAAILLQIDLLDAVLASRDPRSAQALRQARSRHPLRKKEQEVYGDRRDQFLFFCLDEFANIARLQSAIGGDRLKAWIPPAEATSSGLAELSLVEACGHLAERSRQIL